MKRKRWLVIGLILATAVFAWQAGEYSTLQWLELRRREAVERLVVDSLAHEVDSLNRVRKLVETDPGWQERIAREQYGMLRRGEREFTIVK